MTIYKLDLRLPWSTSGVQGPLSSNTFYLENNVVGGMSSNQADSLAALFAGLYEPDGEVIMSSILTGQVEWSVTNMDDPSPRAALYIGNVGFNKGADSLPGECTINLTAGLPRRSGIPAQRNSARVFIGPLATSVLTATGNLTATVLDAIAAEVATINAALPALQSTWVGGSLATGYLPLEGGTVRNECGTIRRRQMAVTEARQFQING